MTLRLAGFICLAIAAYLVAIAAALFISADMWCRALISVAACGLTMGLAGWLTRTPGN